MKIIIYDFEVFQYDTLLGAIIIDNEKYTLYQTWDLDCIRKFYEEHKNDVWIGWNNYNYDDYILNAIIEKKNPYLTSCNLIKTKTKQYMSIKLISFDLMFEVKMLSLKLTELIAGKNIHTTEVDFNLNRQLTKDEKLLTESYNESDLKQTLFNFKMFQDRYSLKCDLANEFNLPIDKVFKSTEAQFAALALGAKKIVGIENRLVKPILYDNLQVKHQEVIDFYMNETFRTDIKVPINICGAELTLCSGGLHSAIKKCFCAKGLYIDISGYYNLVMINYNLLPRTIPEEGKKLYEYMYHEQLKLKKTNPRKRAVYKKVLLAVFGAQNNQYGDFYDPQQALMVTMLGQIYMIDLLEKLDGLVRVIQTNTDGIMLEPYNWDDEAKIIGIIEEWEKRTGFVAKKEHFYNLYQRDVNTYFMDDDKHELVVKGDGMTNYDISEKGYATAGIFNCKEPPIIVQGMIACLRDCIMPEQFVEDNKKELRKFQYACKKNSYDYTEYESINIKTKEVTKIHLQGMDRAFAYKSNDVMGMVYKIKSTNGKTSRSKVSNLPDSVFIYNQSIVEDNAYEKLKDKIDYDYYVSRIYEKINTFIGG